MIVTVTSSYAGRLYLHVEKQYVKDNPMDSSTIQFLAIIITYHILDYISMLKIFRIIFKFMSFLRRY